MSQNTYELPLTYSIANGSLRTAKDDLRSVARLQKGMMVCILFYLLAMSSQAVLVPEMLPIVGLVVLTVALVGAVFLVLLTMELYGIGWGALMSLLSLVPLIGLLVLLAVNGKATRILRKNGIKVGLLGANLSSCGCLCQPTYTRRVCSTRD